MSHCFFSAMASRFHDCDGAFKKLVCSPQTDRVLGIRLPLVWWVSSSMVERVKKLGCESYRVYATIDGVECIEYIQRILRHPYFFRDVEKNTRINILE